MKCKICSSSTKEIFSATLLGKHRGIKYYFCNHCGFLSTQEPFWLDEAYSDAISRSDTGVVARNNSLTTVSSAIIYFFFNKHARFLDYGGGNGIFTRLMRDIGFDFLWDDCYANNEFSRGFEYKNNHKPIELITTFECFEHFPSPLESIKEMLEISPNIFFTTQLLPNQIPKPDDWWYYALDSGQHISFYSLKTLHFIAQKYDLNFYTHWGMHLLCKRKIKPLFYRLVVEYQKRLFSYIKKRMKSKTISDMHYIKNQQTQLLAQATAKSKITKTHRSSA